MRKEFYIFRHGQTDYNCERRWQGCGIDSELNSTGCEQAAQLALLLKDKKLEVIYSSPLKRARKTAEIIGDKLYIPVYCVPELIEGCFGEAEGMLKTEIAEAYPEIFEQWYSPENDLDVGFPGGETKREMQTRMLQAVEALLEAPQNIIGIASHGSSIRYLLMYFGRQPSRMENTALFHLIYDNGTWILEG